MFTRRSWLGLAVVVGVVLSVAYNVLASRGGEDDADIGLGLLVLLLYAGTAVAAVLWVREGRSSRR